MRLKLLSWNIWCDGHFDDIKQFLLSADADILCLQEVLPRSKTIPVVELLTARGYVHAYGAAMEITLSSGENEEMGNAVFSKYPIIRSTVHTLSDEDRRVAVQTDIDIAGDIVHVFSTHLVHSHQKPSSVQELQAENLLKLVPQERSLVAGDFNATPESAAIQLMKAAFADTGTDSEPTWSVYPEGCSVCLPQMIDTRLDYIFASRDLKTSSPKVGSSKGSDHLPISVIVEL
jgi:endonuclease/exonuclease/phosphatase family metal-dependent hydrolase